MTINLNIIIFCFTFLFVLSCKEDTIEELDCSKILFGIPNQNTGLTPKECVSVCTCKGYTPRDFSNADIQTLKEWELTSIIELLESDPYTDEVPNIEDGICAIIIEDAQQKTYSLQSFASKEAAEAAGAILTHYGLCGMCSSLEDLAVYLEFRDLGVTVRECGVQNLLTPFESLVECIEGLGFSEPCAQIWAYNARNTQRNCFEPCMEAILSEALFNTIIPYNNADGSLSPCIGCDEEISGPIFKAFAARTRRNSGIPSGICRFCDGIDPVEHKYPF